MAWYNTSWAYRVRLTIDHTKSPSTVDEFPVYVNMAHLPLSFHNHVKTDASDVRVTRFNGTTEVPFEIVSYSSLDDTGELHFLATSRLDLSDQTYYIYYGNVSASAYAVTDTYGRNNVWTAYNCVLHLQESPNNTANGYVDSTGKAHHGTGTSMSTDGAGKIGGRAQDMDGNLDSINIADHADLNPTVALTVQAWVLPDTWGSGNRRVFQKGNSDEQYRLVNEDTAGTEFLRLDFDGLDTGHEIDQSPPPTTGVWHHLVGTYDGTTNLRLYDNGSIVASSTPSGTGLDTSTGQLSLGAKNGGSGGDNFDGKWDEFRMMPSGVSTNWVTTEYNNQSSPSTFYRIGSEQTNKIRDTIGIGVTPFKR